MEKTDKIYSFIIPHHNCPNLLYRLLDTIPQRDDIEIIVVDDNSDADKVPVITRSDVQLILIPASESKGAGHARNVGLDHATGKWLLFADSDDYYEDGFLDKLDACILDDAVDIVFFSAHMNYIPGATASCSPNVLDLAIQRFKSSKEKLRDIRRLVMSTNVPWNKMYNRDFILRNGVRYEEIPKGNDAWFVVYAGSKATSVKVLDDRLYYYVHNPNGITNSKRVIEQVRPAMLSCIRLNKLRFKYGLYEQLNTKGVLKSRFIKDFGRYEYYRWILYKLIHDYTTIPSYLYGVWFKIRK